MATEKYSAIDHAIYFTTWDGVTFAGESEPDADFIAVSYDNDAVVASEGAKGSVQYSQRVASLGTVTATFQWGSPTNKILNKVFLDQRESNFMQRIEVKRISNTENITVWSADNPLIQKTADYTLGTEAQDRPWSFKVEGLTPGETQDPA